MPVINRNNIVHKMEELLRKIELALKHHMNFIYPDKIPIYIELDELADELALLICHFRYRKPDTTKVIVDKNGGLNITNIVKKTIIKVDLIFFKYKDVFDIFK